MVLYEIQHATAQRSNSLENMHCPSKYLQMTYTYIGNGALLHWMLTTRSVSINLSGAMLVVQRYDLRRLAGQYLDIYHHCDTLGASIEVVERLPVDHNCWYICCQNIYGGGYAPRTNFVYDKSPITFSIAHEVYVTRSWHSSNDATRGTLSWHDLTLILVQVNSYIHYEMLEEIIFPFPIFDGATVDVWE